MDPNLRALCLEVLQGDINSELFSWLLIETGVDVGDFEWRIARKLLEQGDAINSLTQKFGNTIQ